MPDIDPTVTDLTPEANLYSEDACSDYRVELEDKVRELQEENRRLRAVPFERGPDGEPNGPDLGAYDDLRTRANNLEVVIGRLVHWTNARAGRSPNPPDSTYAEGMKVAKRQVADIISSISRRAEAYRDDGNQEHLVDPAPEEDEWKEEPDDFFGPGTMW
jgi:hypothetical protein